MALEEQLFIATLNGVPFLVDSAETKQGRKTKTFEYPNKKSTFVEDLGERLRTFSLKAVITGEFYLLTRELFVLALQKKGKSLLTHPFYGMVFVTVKDYTISEDTTRLGECSFDITFEEATVNIFPISGEEGIASIAGIVNEVAPYVAAFAVTAFSTSFKKNMGDAADKSDKLNNSLQPTKPVETQGNAWDSFKSKSDDFNTKKYSLMQDNSTFFDAIADLLSAYNDLGKTASDSYELNSTAYYFGKDDISIKETTAERKQRALNRKIYNSYVNASLIMTLYQNALEITYLDDQQIVAKEKDLEKKYQYLMNHNVLDKDVLGRLATLRNAVKKFFNNLKVNISKVITIKVPKTPLTTLLYRYYADFDNEDEIIALNNLNNVTKIKGDIKILTVEQ